MSNHPLAKHPQHEPPPQQVICKVRSQAPGDTARLDRLATLLATALSRRLSQDQSFVPDDSV